MIPSLSEWNKWSKLEKVSYVAQLTTALSFLAASSFSYLSWREARLARDDQRSFFIEEKAPSLVLSSVRVLKMDGADSYIVKLHVKNEGGSSAHNLDFSVFKNSEEQFPGFIGPMDKFNENVTIDKGKEKEVIAAIIRPDGIKFHLLLESSRLRSDTDRIKTEMYALINIRYDGPFGDVHSDDYYIVADKK